MADLWLVVAVGAITYASRAALLVSPRRLPTGIVAQFLEVFPLALFVALATSGLAAPDGDPDVGIELVAAGGGVLGAALFRRSLIGVIALGVAGYWIARGLVG